MYRRVLVPLDGSTVAMQVLPYTAYIAKAAGAKLELMQVISPYPRELMRELTRENREGQPRTTPLYEQWASVQEGLRRRAMDALNEASASMRGSGLDVTVTVDEGDPAQEILNVAGREPDTIIAISTHGRSGVGRWLVGSVTDKVVRYAAEPVLVVRSRDGEVTSAAPRFERVILPMDGSPTSEAAMPDAIAVANALGIGMTLLRSVTPIDYGDAFADYAVSAYEEVTAEIDNEVRDYLSAKAELVRGAGVMDVTQHAAGSPAATAILDAEGPEGNNLIVMATHGRAGVGRWVLGSVTDRVVRHSVGPVLVVRPKNAA